MGFIYWISKATDLNTQKYVTLIAFLRQQWLRERASVLRYTYVASLVLVSSRYLCLEGIQCLLD
jgi:hypothetical protein